MPATDQNLSAASELRPPTPPGANLGDGRVGDTKQYEFRDTENRIIGQLAWKMNFVGLFLFANGILIVAIGIHPLFHVGPIISGALMCVVGLWTQRASASFQSVVDTEGRDISHLMKALDDLRKLYSLQYWLVIVGVILALVGLWAINWGYVDIIG